MNATAAAETARPVELLTADQKNVLDSFVRMFNAQHGDFAAEANRAVATIKAASGEKVSPVKFFADSEDSAIVELLEKLDKAKRAVAAIDEMLSNRMAEELKATSGSSEEAREWLKASQKSVTELIKQRKALISTVTAMTSGPGVEEYLNEELATVERPKGSARNSGIKRPRFESITVNGDDLPKPILTALAHHTKVSKEDIDTALYAAAGVDDVADYTGDAIEFILTDKLGERFEVVAVPKASAVKAEAEESADVEADDVDDAEDIEPTEEDLNAEDVFDEEDED